MGVGGLVAGGEGVGDDVVGVCKGVKVVHDRSGAL